MKKVFSFVALAAAMMFAGQAYAQLSVNAGYTSKTFTSTTKYGDNTNTKTYSLGGGFFVGGSYSVGMSDGLNVTPGLYFTYNTDKDEDHGVTTTINTMDLNIPILFSYTYSLSSDLALFAFVGPNIQLGLSAQEKVEGTPGGILDGTADLYEKDDDGESMFTRFDLGIMVGLGVQYQNFRLQAGYNKGLLDRCGYEDGDNYSFEYAMSQIFVGVGFAF